MRKPKERFKKQRIAQASPPPAPVSPAQAHFDRAWEIAQKGDADTSYRMLVAGCWEYPFYADGWWKLGTSLSGMKKHAAAAVAFARCADVALNEGPASKFYAGGLAATGWALHQSGRSEEAVEWVEAAVRINPELDIAWENLSQVRLALDDLDASARCAQRALMLNPKYEMHKLAMALTQLHAGEYLDGFKNYESRIPLHIKDLLHFPYPMWRGETLKGRLLILAEQGIGDAINMLRYVVPASKLVGGVVVHCHPEVAALFRQNLPETIEVIAMPQPTPAECEAFIPMMSLPVCLKITKEDVARDCATYVTPKLPMNPPGDGRFHVGIVWSGSPVHMADEFRSAKLTDFLPLGEVQGVSLNSFQIGHVAMEVNSGLAGAFIRNWAPEISNFADTANILAGMDLVISVDTAIVHLCGAMGKECWVLVSQQAADYRWGRTEDTTIWYPSLRLYRQELREPWADVILRIRDDLHLKIQATRGPMPKSAQKLAAHVLGMQPMGADL